MNVIFLTLFDIRTYSEHNIYCDLLREFEKNGHNVYCVSPIERRFKTKTHLEENGRLLKLKIGNTQKTNIIEKGISTLLIQGQFVKAIRKYFRGVKFDLVLYSTPPITLGKAVKFIKKRDNAKSYLMLKDIFPQNAVDLGMMHKTGLKSVLYKYFRRKEQKLYNLSDKIGCMSPANVDFLLKHNSYVDKEKVEICPNAIEVQEVSLTEIEINQMRIKYDIPLNKKVFVYGGNLGKPQGVDFIIDSIKTQLDNDSVYFLIVGDGTHFAKINEFIEIEKPQNVKLLKRLPRDDYERMISACDVGMIYLDSRFTIPNFPSRLLSYLQAKKPVLACTDKNTDIGNIIVDNGFGWWCESNDLKAFEECIEKVACSNLIDMGEKGYDFLIENYTSEKAYKIIEGFLNESFTNK